jgi:hypothetical protein
VLGRRDPQATIFDGDQVYLEHVGRKTFYAYLAHERHELFKDEDFAGLYHERWGRPSVPPSSLCVALVLQAYEGGCSDREASDRAAFDQRWKVALGCGEMERPFVRSTLQLFRAQLLTHEKQMALFEASLEAARRSGRLRRDGRIRVALDTTGILGRGAVKDTYNLLSDGIVKVMRELAKGSGQPLEKWARSKDLGHYLGSSLKGEADIDWDEAEARSGLLGQLVEDAERVLELTRRARSGCAEGSQADERLLQASQVLGQVLGRDVERKPEGGVEIRKGTSAERVCSVQDPEMRHGRKNKSTRFDGHKLAVATDVESQIITAIDVMAGSAKDDEGSLELAQQSEVNTGLEVEAVLGDCAYGTGANRERFAEANTPLLAKVPRRPKGEYFSKDQFEIDLEQMSCRCPAGQVTTKLVGHGRGERAFQFERAICAACPLRQSCFKTKGKGRTVNLHPQEAHLQEARTWQGSPEFEVFRKQRQVVEHRIARLIQLGMRQAHYVGRGKVRFQALMAATVANLTLIAGPDGHRSQPGRRSTATALASVAVERLPTAIRARMEAGRRWFAARTHRSRLPTALRFAPAETACSRQAS